MPPLTTFAHANAARYRNLSSDGAGTLQEQQQSVAQLSQSLAIGERDVAALQTARGQRAVLQAARRRRSPRCGALRRRGNRRG